MSIRTSLKKVLPPISITEQEALEAGDVWLEASIYQGKPDMHALRNMPTAKLSAEERPCSSSIVDDRRFRASG
jgi:acyl-CoA dehydrogenase